MLKTFRPETGNSIVLSNHALIWIRSGTGLIEIDFNPYDQFDDKFIFLSPDQHLKFTYGDFEVMILEFATKYIHKSKDYRVLFKHLISLGYIEFERSDQQLANTLFAEDQQEILDLSASHWFWQNPFKANREEYTIIFDLKDLIDARYHEHLRVDQFLSDLDYDRSLVQRLVKSRVGLTIKSLAQHKVLSESKKDIALTDKNIQEISYDHGFKDPAYFNRFFKKKTSYTPVEFRDIYGSPSTDLFIQDLMHLIKTHHRSHRDTAFYAAKTHLHIKTLSRKVKSKLNLTVGQLIRNEVIKSAQSLLTQTSVKEVSDQLGFEEANHFSAFFKKYTGLNPTDYQAKKYHS